MGCAFGSLLVALISQSQAVDTAPLSPLLAVRCRLLVGALSRLRQLPGRMGRLPSRVAFRPKVAESFYLSAEWKAYRAAHRAQTKARHGGVWCCVCGGGGRLILDHVIERRDGGPDFPPFDGAKWYCAGCHNTKTARAKAQRVRGGPR